MLADISRASHIYIVCGYTDMRKSIDGLCAVIQDQLQMNPSGSSLFLFCGRRCDRIKALLKEPDGYVLIYKRLTAQYGRYLQFTELSGRCSVFERPLSDAKRPLFF